MWIYKYEYGCLHIHKIRITNFDAYLGMYTNINIGAHARMNSTIYVFSNRMYDDTYYNILRKLFSLSTHSLVCNQTVPSLIFLDQVFL